MGLATTLKSVWDTVSGNNMLDKRPGLEGYKKGFGKFVFGNIIAGAILGGILDQLTVPQAIGIFMAIDAVMNPLYALEKTAVYDKLEEKGRLKDLAESPSTPAP